MSKKRLTRITCTAGLLLVELAPTATAQTFEPPDDTTDGSVPVTSDQHSKQLDTTNDASTIAPEQVSVVERTRPVETAAIPDRVIARSLKTPAIAQPERLAPPASVARTRDVVVSTRAQDLIAPPPAAIAVSQPEAIRLQTRQVAPAAPTSLSSVSSPSASVSAAPTPISTPVSISSTASTPTPPSSPRPQASYPPLPPPPPDPTDPAEPDSQTVVAQTAPLPPGSQVPVPRPAAAPIPPKVGGIFTTGPGVGYSSSYSGLKGFIPITQQPGQKITFAETQAFVDTGNGNPSANVVLGHRFYDAKSDRIYGGYLAYDYRNTGRNGFNQVGLGLETLGRSWDARINAYLPFGATRQLTSQNTSTTTTFGDPFFQTNFLAANRTVVQQIDRRFEAAAAGVDVEAGGKITQVGDGELRGYGGLYYFGAPKGEGTVGWRTRLELRPTENLQLGVALSRDNNYGTNVALSVGVTFPTNNSGTRRDRPADPLLARLGDPTNRNANIVLDRQVETRRTTTQDVALIENPATGQPWRFRHAVPGVGTGDGTFENPTGSVAAAVAVAQPDDIVYVQPGTNPGVAGFTIPDRVQVLSTGPIQRIDTVQLGNIPLPLSGAGVLPSVNSTITLGNSTTLSGFNISAANGAGIVGNNISQVTVRDNVIGNTTFQGIALNNVQGQVNITDNVINQARGGGVALNNTAGQVDLLLARNQITNNGATSPTGDGVNVQLRNGATGNFTIQNNTIANNSNLGGSANGVNAQLFDAANGNFNVTNNAITGNQASGTAITAESTARGTFNLNGNTIANNQINGVDALLSNNAQAQINLNGNAITGNQINGVQAIAADQTTANLNLANNTISNNQLDGVFLQTANQANLTANLTRNIITNNLNSGVSSFANDASNQRLFVESNTIANNGFLGLDLSTSGTAQTLATLRANTITGNLFTDAAALTAPGSRVCLQPLNNTIGSLILDDSLGASGQVQVEAGALPTNTITTSDFTNWSNTLVPAGTCGF